MTLAIAVAAVRVGAKTVKAAREKAFIVGRASLAMEDAAILAKSVQDIPQLEQAFGRPDL